MNKFNTLDELSMAVDKVISDNINKFFNEETIQESFELIADELNKNNSANLTQEEFEKIAQISSAMVKCLAKPICYAALDSLSIVNSLQKENEHLY